MNDWAFIRPMIYNGLPMVNGEPLRELREKNYGTNDLDVHFNENSTRVDVEWTPNPALSVRNVTSVLHGDRLWHAGPWQLNYRPATNDVIGDFYGNWDQDQLQFNNQISVTSRRPLSGRDHTFVVGGDVEKLDFTRIVTLWPDLTSEFSLFNPEPGNRPTTGGVTSSALTALVTRYSIFAEDRLKVTPALSLVGGVRYDHQQWGRVELATPGRSRVDRIDNPVNWRAGGVYEVRPNTNIYAQYSVATDRGAWIAEATVEQMALKPTRGRQIEVGIKQSTRDSRLEWTVAGYRIKKTDLLIFNRSPTFSPGEIYEPYLQVGAQSSVGVEASFTVDAGRGLRVSANGTVLKPKFDEFFEDVDGVPTSRNGNRPFNVPWQSGNLMATWAFHRNWLAQGALRFVGQRYINTANTLSLQTTRWWTPA
jgi:iron complex outermembrane recepter protein